jgi:hypothetical protein
MNTHTNENTDQGAEKPLPLFAPFQWLGPLGQRDPYDLLTDVRDLAAGVTVALQMVERSNMQEETGNAPLFDLDTKYRLTRMSIAAMRCIEERIDAHFDTMGQQGSKA